MEKLEKKCAASSCTLDAGAGAELRRNADILPRRMTCVKPRVTPYSRAISLLLDDAIAKAERLQHLADYYADRACRARLVKTALERQIDALEAADG